MPRWEHLHVWLARPGLCPRASPAQGLHTSPLFLTPATPGPAFGSLYRPPPPALLNKTWALPPKLWVPSFAWERDPVNEANKRRERERGLQRVSPGLPPPRLRLHFCLQVTSEALPPGDLSPYLVSSPCFSQSHFSTVNPTPALPCEIIMPPENADNISNLKFSNGYIFFGK